ncbi:MAG: MBL fold metallo-hydrolase [Gemmatimonadaceae bacterium]
MPFTITVAAGCLNASSKDAISNSFVFGTIWMRRSTGARCILPWLFALGCTHRPSPSATIPPVHHEQSIQPGVLPPTWYAGSADGGGREDFQVHAYNDDFYILRQAAYTNYEKPFLYLLFGQERAILFDTGAGKVKVGAAVDGIIRGWLARHGRQSIPLIVAHSHGHGDHVAGDDQFLNRPGITVVGRDTASVRAFFGIHRWPDEIVTFDLGGREIDVLPIPGHQPASIAVYDRQTGIMLTGDTFYPGRLYVRDSAAFANSIQRLVDFTHDRPVAHFLGTHIENTSVPFRDYPVGTVDQPDEHALQLTRAQLVELNDRIRAMRGHLTRLVMTDLTIWPVAP